MEYTIDEYENAELDEKLMIFSVMIPIQVF